MRIVNPAAIAMIAFVVLSSFVVAARADEQGISTAPAQSTAAPSRQPRPVTLAELKLILESTLDCGWKAGAYLKGLVDLGPNARRATNTIYLVFPWPVDAEDKALTEVLCKVATVREKK